MGGLGRKLTKTTAKQNEVLKCVGFCACVYVRLCSESAEIFSNFGHMLICGWQSGVHKKKAYCCDTTASIHKWAITLFFRALAICLLTILWHVSLFSHTLILRNKSDSITTDWLKPLYQYSSSRTNVTSLCMVDLVWHMPRAVDRGWINSSLLPLH